MNDFVGKNRKMFRQRKPGSAKKALGILASSRELMNAVEPVRNPETGLQEFNMTEKLLSGRAPVNPAGYSDSTFIRDSVLPLLQASGDRRPNMRTGGRPVVNPATVGGGGVSLFGSAAAAEAPQAGDVQATTTATTPVTTQRNASPVEDVVSPADETAMTKAVLQFLSGEDKQDAKMVLSEMGQDPELAERNDFWEAVTMAGLGIASGESPRAMKNISDGLLLGMQSYRQARKERRDTEYTRALQQATMDLNERKVRAAEAGVAVDLLSGERKSRTERLTLADEYAEEYGVSKSAGDRLSRAADDPDAFEEILASSLPQEAVFDSEQEALRASEKFPKIVIRQRKGRATVSTVVNNPNYDPDAK